jgi:hypothetical protein
MSRRKNPIAKCGCWKDSKGVDHGPGCECTGKKPPEDDTEIPADDTTGNPGEKGEEEEETTDATS